MAKPDLALQLRIDGFAIERQFLTPEQVEQTRQSLYVIQQMRQPRNAELGVLRLMMDDDPSLLYLLELPRMLEIIDQTLGPSAIMHLQNGFILPSQDNPPEVFQNSMHMDFPRIINGYVASINVLVALDDFTKDSGATRARSGSHQGGEYWDEVDLVCAAGDAIVFDSTLMHCAGINRSGKDRCAINHQFTNHWIKQQMDYPMALEWLEGNLNPRTRQLLGFNSRPPASLDEYYAVPRRYLAGQG